MNELISLDEQLKVVAVLAMIGLGSLFEETDMENFIPLVAELHEQLDTLDDATDLMDTLMQHDPEQILQVVINFNKGLQ